jgi:hypothetical protein
MRSINKIFCALSFLIVTLFSSIINADFSTSAGKSTGSDQAGFTISYDLNGGVGIPPIDNILYQYKTVAVILSGSNISSSRPGYVFMGWSIYRTGRNQLNQKRIYQPGDIYTVWQSAVLYAVWGVTVNFDAVIGNEVILPGQAYLPGDRVILPDAPMLPNHGDHKFIAWSMISNGCGTTFLPKQSFAMPEQPVTLYPIYGNESDIETIRKTGLKWPEGEHRYRACGPNVSGFGPYAPGNYEEL